MHPRRNAEGNWNVQGEEEERTQRETMSWKLDDSGIAYGYLMLSIFLLAAAFIWMVVSHTFNLTLTNVINPDIVSGGISMQTRNAIDWNVNIIRYAPPILLIGAFVFAVNRAIYKRGGV